MAHPSPKWARFWLCGWCRIGEMSVREDYCTQCAKRRDPSATYLSGDAPQPSGANVTQESVHHTLPSSPLPTSLSSEIPAIEQGERTSGGSNLQFLGAGRFSRPGSEDQSGWRRIRERASWTRSLPRQSDSRSAWPSASQRDLLKEAGDWLDAHFPVPDPQTLEDEDNSTDGKIVYNERENKLRDLLDKIQKDRNSGKAATAATPSREAKIRRYLREIQAQEDSLKGTNPVEQKAHEAGRRLSDPSFSYADIIERSEVAAQDFPSRATGIEAEPPFEHSFLRDDFEPEISRNEHDNPAGSSTLVRTASYSTIVNEDLNLGQMNEFRSTGVGPSHNATTEHGQDRDLETSDFENQSVCSVVESVGSATTLIDAPDAILNAAADEFASDLLRQDEVKHILKKAVSSKGLNEDRFERKFRRLLTRLSWSLRKSAYEPDQRAATALIRRRSRYIAHEIRLVTTGQNILRLNDEKSDEKSMIERYLEELQGTSHQIERHPLRKADSDSEGESDASLEEWGTENEISNLSSVKRFLFGSESFLDFRASLWNLVDPSLKSKLDSIQADISDSAIQVMAAEENQDWTNNLKRTVEKFTSTSWDWWPMEQCKPAIVPGYKRLLWQCKCGSDRFEDVPAFFAERLTKLSGLQPSSMPTSSQTIRPERAYFSESQARSESTIQSGNPSSSSNSQGIPNQIQPFGFSPLGATMKGQTAVDMPIGTQLFVFLSVPNASGLCLEQMKIVGYTDDSFFKQLQTSYLGAKGLLRRVFSIYIYAHCDFFKFEKYDTDEHAPREKGMPPADDLLYQYHPVKDDPPVTTHQFESRFYACHRRCLSAFMGIRNPFHKCRTPCNHTADAVNRVPKRVRPLDIGGSAQEIFWGLKAVERPCFVKVAIFHVIPIVPTLIFWFLWLFYYGHTGDLQNASVPFLCVMGLITLFWASLYGGKAVLGA